MGLMMRENWVSDGPMVFIGFTNENEVHFVSRNETNVPVTSVASVTIPSLPYWVRLKLVGDAVEGYISPSGSAWNLIGTTTFFVTAPYLAGIVQNSGSAHAIATGIGDSFLVYVGNCD